MFLLLAKTDVCYTVDQNILLRHLKTLCTIFTFDQFLIKKILWPIFNLKKNSHDKKNLLKLNKQHKLNTLVFILLTHDNLYFSV
jgi:hypothetical protein